MRESNAMKLLLERGGVQHRPKVKICMWLPIDLVEVLDSIGGRSRAANIVAILDQAIKDAGYKARAVRKATGARTRAGRPKASKASKAVG